MHGQYNVHKNASVEMPLPDESTRRCFCRRWERQLKICLFWRGASVHRRTAVDGPSVRRYLVLSFFRLRGERARARARGRRPVALVSPTGGRLSIYSFANAICRASRCPFGRLFESITPSELLRSAGNPTRRRRPGATQALARRLTSPSTAASTTGHRPAARRCTLQLK